MVVDVFTDTPLQGNQLAVFTDGRGIAEELLQPLAREMAFSETVYCYPATQHASPNEAGWQVTVRRESDGSVSVPPSTEADVRIRIFTPDRELPFAGHPTLGTAFVLGAPLQLGVVRLETGAGIIPVELEREGARIVFGRMQQPIPVAEPYAREAELLAALGVERSGLPVEAYLNGPLHVYVELESEAAVAALRPDAAALVPLDIGANCFAGSGACWKTRMFAPAHGVLEDAATGSAAGPLAVHLARHGRIAWGDEIEISQGAEIGRPSTLYARATGSAERIESVEVGGSAVVVARGEFRLP